MPLDTALRRSNVARRLWHVLPYRVRDEVWKSTYRGRWVRDVFHTHGHWVREVMRRDIEALIELLDPSGLNVVEVSGGRRSGYPWASYTQLAYPEFDLCDPPATHGGHYDLVICEQVLEHVDNPVTAVHTLKALCAPGGMLLVSTPFLIRIHHHPADYWRFTPDGLRKLLECQGLHVEWVRSWGNRAAVRRNLRVWVHYWPWRSLKNDPDVPVMVWALARSTDASEA